MRERHLDGTVFISGAGGTVFESLAHLTYVPLTRSERTSLTAVDRDTALIGI
jgi:hypothetical protein